MSRSKHCELLTTGTHLLNKQIEGSGDHLLCILVHRTSEFETESKASAGGDVKVRKLGDLVDGSGR